MNTEIQDYNDLQSYKDREICNVLCKEINQNLPKAESKIWHAYPVWFLDGNPVVGFSKLKDCIRLMFWSGADFIEEQLKPGTGKFKDSSIRYTDAEQISKSDLKRWLEKARDIHGITKISSRGKAN